MQLENGSTEAQRTKKKKIWKNKQCRKVSGENLLSVHVNKKK